MDNIQIKKVLNEDWEKYNVLRVLALKLEPTAFSSTTEEVVNRTKNDYDFKTSLETDTSITLGAYHDERLVGVLTIYRTNKPKTMHVANIAGVFTDPEYREKGVAGSLMKSAIEELTNAKIFTIARLGVTKGNIPAINLYKKFGFEEYGVAKQELKIEGSFYDMVLMDKLF